MTLEEQKKLALGNCITAETWVMAHHRWNTRHLAAFGASLVWTTWGLLHHFPAFTVVLPLLAVSLGMGLWSMFWYLTMDKFTEKMWGTWSEEVQDYVGNETDLLAELTIRNMAQKELE